MGAKQRDNDETGSSVKLAPLDIDTILAHRHAQILHGQHRPVLAASLPATAITRSLNAQRRTLILVFAPRLARLLARNGETRGGAEGAHGVVGVCVARGADAAVLVCVGGNVGNEFLGGEGEETGEALVGLGRRGEAGLGHVVLRDGVGDL